MTGHDDAGKRKRGMDILYMLHSDDVLRKSYGKIYADNGLGASYGEFSDLLKSTDGMKIAEALEKLSDFVPGR